MEGTSHRTVAAVLGASSRLARAGVALHRRAEPITGPVGRTLLRPPLLPARWQPATWLETLVDEGAVEEAALRQRVSRLLDTLVPLIAVEVLRRARLDEVIVQTVDLDAVVAAVDLDTAAARLDVDAVVGRADLDAVAKRLDVDAVVRRVDLDAILDRLDLNAIILQRVDLGAVVDAVLDRVDLPALTGQVLDEIDLPEIIRESSGSMASDTVQGVRMQGITADEAMGRAVDRFLLRRRRGHEG